MTLKNVREWIANQICRDAGSSFIPGKSRWFCDNVIPGEKKCTIIMGHHPNLLTDNAIERRTFLVSVEEVAEDQEKSGEPPHDPIHWHLGVNDASASRPPEGLTPSYLKGYAEARKAMRIIGSTKNIVRCKCCGTVPCGSCD
ncbi:MAG TPA: hypothetical protein ENI23_17395 [bacterium]|nr:hypothetical protein [bacterium]